MEYIGHLVGEAAEKCRIKYPDYVYTRAKLGPLRMVLEKDYPGDVFLAVSAIDYAVRFVRQGFDGLSKVQVWLRQNRYTQARGEKCVYELLAANAYKLREQYYDEVMQNFFGVGTNTQGTQVLKNSKSYRL